MVSVPLPYAVTSIWPLPFGLLLQRSSEGNLLTNISLSSSNPFLSARDVFHQKRDVYTPTHMFDYCTRSDGASVSSHMILKDPLEDPQVPIYGFFFSQFHVNLFHIFLNISFC